MAYFILTSLDIKIHIENNSSTFKQDTLINVPVKTNLYKKSTLHTKSEYDQVIPQSHTADRDEEHLQDVRKTETQTNQFSSSSR